MRRQSIGLLRVQNSLRQDLPLPRLSERDAASPLGLVSYRIRQTRLQVGLSLGITSPAVMRANLLTVRHWPFK
jgi:hypothetical protein